MENTRITFTLDLTPEQYKLISWHIPLFQVYLKGYLQEKVGEMLTDSAKFLQGTRDPKELAFMDGLTTPLEET